MTQTATLTPIIPFGGGTNRGRAWHHHKAVEFVTKDEKDGFAIPGSLPTHRPVNHSHDFGRFKHTHEPSDRHGAYDSAIITEDGIRREVNY